MKIQNFDESFRLSIINNLNQMNAHFNPEDQYILDEAWFSNYLKQYDQTDPTRDILIAIDEQGVVQGSMALSKRSNTDFWYLDVAVSPDHIDSTLPGELLEKGLELAREQGAPAIHAVHHVRFTALRDKLEQLGHKPVESSWAVELTDIESAPKIEPSPNILLRKQEGEHDLMSYTELYNEVFKKTFSFIPATVENLKYNEEALNKEEFERWFAFEGDIMTGFVIIQRSNNPDQKHKGSINYMGVRPSHQRHGIGSAMLAKGIQRLQEKGCTVVTSGGNESVKPAAKLFHKFGFSDIANQNFVTYAID